MKRVLITGPESTGKSELTLALSKHYKGKAIPEYARDYIENLDRSYTFSDVEHIARKQQESYKSARESGSIYFFDTWLIITRVWFEVVFGKVPSWLDEQIREASFDLVLLCHTDLPWVSDGIRENGGKMRNKLLGRYRQLIREAGWECVTVRGLGERRLNNAIQLLEKHRILC